MERRNGEKKWRDGVERWSGEMEGRDRVERQRRHRLERQRRCTLERQRRGLRGDMEGREWRIGLVKKYGVEGNRVERQTVDT